MKKNFFHAIILALLIVLFSSPNSFAEVRPIWQSLETYKMNTSKYDPFNPYLEDTKHLQIPQWEDENWYVEDWTSQKDGIELIKDFYEADIIRNQIIGKNDLPILLVGPNFYHLSGLDKRRVTQTIDTIYGITAEKENGSFLVQDWNTRKYIGAFDKNGLRLN